MSVIPSNDVAPQHDFPVPAAPANGSSDVHILDPHGLRAGATVCNGQRPVLLWIAQGAVNLEWRPQHGSWRPLLLRDGDFYLAASGSVQLRRACWCQLAFEGISLDIGRQVLSRCIDAARSAVAALPGHDISGTADPTMRALLELLHATRRQTVSPSRPFVEGLAQAVVSQLASSDSGTRCDQRMTHLGLPPYKLRLVSHAMCDRLTEPFDLKYLARVAGLSAFHFSRSFKKASGMAPSRYFQRLRVEQAKRMLSSNEQPIIDIAMAVGFRTPSHFSQVFRELAGMSPSEYRSRRASRPNASWGEVAIGGAIHTAGARIAGRTPLLPPQHV